MVTISRCACLKWTISKTHLWVLERSHTHWGSLRYTYLDLNQFDCLLFHNFPATQYSQFSFSRIWSHSPSRCTEHQNEIKPHRYWLSHHAWLTNAHSGWPQAAELKGDMLKTKKKEPEEKKHIIHHIIIFLWGNCPKPQLNRRDPDKPQASAWGQQRATFSGARQIGNKLAPMKTTQKFQSSHT